MLGKSFQVSGRMQYRPGMADIVALAHEAELISLMTASPFLMAAIAAVLVRTAVLVHRSWSRSLPRLGQPAWL